MASFYNAQRLEFNPNAAIIQNAGAFGNALYKLYSDGFARDLAQQEQAERGRHNQAVEAHNDATLKEHQAQNAFNRKMETDKFTYSQGRDKVLDERDARNFAADQRYKNAHLGLMAQNAAEARAQRKAEADALASHRAQLLALKQAEMAAKQGESGDLGLSFKNMPAGTQTKLAALKTAAQNLGDYDKAVKDARGVGGTASNTGVWDANIGALANKMGIPSAQNAELVALRDAAAQSYAQTLKGNGSINYTRAQDDLTPYRVDAGVLDASINSKAREIVKGYDNIINVALAQGNYKAAEILNNEKAQILGGFSELTQKSLNPQAAAATQSENWTQVADAPQANTQATQSAPQDSLDGFDEIELGGQKAHARIIDENTIEIQNASGQRITVTAEQLRAQGLL